jgi:hypothetical protein
MLSLLLLFIYIQYFLFYNLCRGGARLWFEDRQNRQHQVWRLMVILAAELSELNGLERKRAGW